MKTFLAKKEDVKKGWVVIDVKDKILGRAATEIAEVLRGKNRPTYTRHVDTGDFVVVINASKIKLTGNKWEDKMYHDHSGYTGGIKSVPAIKVLTKNPEKMITKAVKGMLPKNDLSKKILKKLKVYPDANYPHSAQKPEELKLTC